MTMIEFVRVKMGARPMAGLQTLDLYIEVRILCPQLHQESTLHPHQGASFFDQEIDVYDQ